MAIAYVLLNSELGQGSQIETSLKDVHEMKEVYGVYGVYDCARTRFATTCLFCVFIISLMALQVWVMYPLWLNVVLVGAIIVFTWRTFNSYMAYGWW